MVSWLWKGGSADDDNEEDLKKKGFDPQSLEVGVAAEEAITDFSKDYEGWLSPTREELAALLANYKYPAVDAGSSATTRSIGTSWPTPREAGAAATRARCRRCGPSARR